MYFVLSMHQLYFTSSLLTILGGEVFRNQLGGGILPAEPHFRDPAQIYEIDDIEGSMSIVAWKAVILGSELEFMIPYLRGGSDKS